jgi:hypothetical protein
MRIALLSILKSQDLGVDDHAVSYFNRPADRRVPVLSPMPVSYLLSPRP